MSDQSLVDKTLIAGPASLVRFPSEPVQHSIVQTDRDPRLPRFHRNYRPPFRPGKIIFILHFCSSYSRSSDGVAGRAEIKRLTSARHVQTTTLTRPVASLPSVIHRSSSSEPASCM